MREDACTAVCEEIAGKLRDLAIMWSAGAVSEEAFIQAVLAIEEFRARKHGITVTASNTIDDWTVFTLKIDSGAMCGAFEFLPQTGEFRKVGSGPKRLGAGERQLSWCGRA